MRTALIGHSGFVGGNLLAQAPWDDLYNSKNIQDLAGKRYDLVVCAGAPAAKWLINQNPDADAAGLARLKAALAAARVAELVLISTIDVYAPPVAVDESTVIDPRGHHAYGRHRLELEQFCAARLPTRVLRLPGLFGKGLKKNVIYDMLHGNQLEKIDPDAAFQYYDLRHLAADIAKVRALDLALVNLATPPLRTARIAEALFGLELAPKPGPHGQYDMRSRHSHHWQRTDGYLYSAEDVWADLAAFVATARAELP